MSIKMNRSQRRAVNRIVRFYRQRNAYTGCTSVRVRVEPTDYGTLWVTVETRRSDCGKYSQRAVFCAQSAFISVGRRGAIGVAHTRDGLTDEKDHVASQLRGKTI